MKRALYHGLGALLFCTLALAALAQTTFFWSGVGNGWQGQVTPPNDGTANLYLSHYAINETVPVDSFLNLNSIVFAAGGSDDTYKIQSTLGGTLLFSSGGGIISTGTYLSRLEFGSNLNIAKNGTLAMDAATSTIVIPGQITDPITGSTALALISSNTNPNFVGAFVFNNTGAGNTYTGATTIGGVTGSFFTVAFWNGSPFGNGPVSVFSSVQLVAHNNLTIANPLTFSTTTPNDPVYFRSWDAPLTLSGPVTLGTNTTIVAQSTPHGVPSADNTGIYPTPGSPSRNPIVFTGAISGAHSLTVGGVGVVILNPSSPNTYSGGTVVNGSLVIGSNTAIPATPAVGPIMVNNSGYAGYADTTPGNFTSFLAGSVNVGSTGAVGVDTLPGASVPNTFADPIDLTRFVSSPSIRIGTATSAIITGTITPQGGDYQFGNGGGTLYVQSTLSDVPTFVSNLQLTDANNAGLVSPLKVILQSYPGYTGKTIANNGFIIFDESGLPSGQLVAAGSSTNTGASYIGGSNLLDYTPSSFLSYFDKANTWGIIGFDTHATYPTFDTGSLDLTGFNNGVYLGTATSAILSGTLTPTADNILRLTAANGGTLTVNANITGSTALALGTPSTAWAYSNGTIILNGANTYTGGTTFNSLGSGITVEAGTAGAFGTGPLTLPQNVVAGLQTSSYLTLPNPIVFQTPAVNNSPASLYLTGINGFELSGAISGPGSLNLLTPVTLSGNNSGFTGDINFVQGSTLTVNNNNGFGTGTVYFNHTNSSINLGAATATAPVLYGIEGDSGFINLLPGTVLTFDMSNQNNGSDFGGVIGNEGLVAASLVITASVNGNALYLHGNNNYTGGTTITNYGAVALGNNNALGTGMVTLNATSGGVALNNGITFTNPLTFTAGALMGFGTFAPSNLTTITVGANQAVIPGVYTIVNQNLPGYLTFATNLTFANGGHYYWSLQDVSRSDGYSELFISGNLDLTTISTGGFTLNVLTFDATNNLGLANLVVGQPYTFTILSTTGTITGFNAANFALNTSKFENGQMPLSLFSLTADSSHLYLSFTAIPEPSTWALLASGASLLGVAALRRRRV